MFIQDLSFSMRLGVVFNKEKLGLALIYNKKTFMGGERLF